MQEISRPMPITEEAPDAAALSAGDGLAQEQKNPFLSALGERVRSLRAPQQGTCMVPLTPSDPWWMRRGVALAAAARRARAPGLALSRAHLIAANPPLPPPYARSRPLPGIPSNVKSLVTSTGACPAAPSCNTPLTRALVIVGSMSACRSCSVVLTVATLPPTGAASAHSASSRPRRPIQVKLLATVRHQPFLQPCVVHITCMLYPVCGGLSHSISLRCGRRAADCELCARCYSANAAAGLACARPPPAAHSRLSLCAI